MNKYLTTLALIMLMLGLPASGKKNNAPNDSNLPGGALPGAFSVSDTMKVHFSKGNLRQRINPDLEGDILLYFESGWAENQYDLYYSDFQYLFTAEELEEELKFGRGKEGWRTLTADEWDYLLGDSKERNKKYRLGVTVCDSPNCLIIAPDNFTGAIADSYNLSTWEKAESDGLVCLPAAGYENSELTEVGHFGFYWNYFGFGGSMGSCMEFSDSWIDVTVLGPYDSRYSVRLVMECSISKAVENMLNAKYDSIQLIENVYFRVKHNGKVGACDLKGKELVPPKYSDIKRRNGKFVVILPGTDNWVSVDDLISRNTNYKSL